MGILGRIIANMLRPSVGVGACFTFLIVVLNALAQQQNAPSKPNTSRYTIVHSAMVDGTEFISVVVRPGISDSELMAVATELHRLHPQSAILFYDSMNVPKIKLYRACFVKMMHKLDSPSCTDALFEWNSEHEIGWVLSFYDDPSRTGKPRWELDRGLRKIGDLGINDRPSQPEKLVPKPQRPQIGEAARLLGGQVRIIETALTPYDYGQYTKCFDGADNIDCVVKLLDTRKIFQVPGGTKVQVLGFRDNPSHASVLTGRIIQVRILEGAFRGQAMWTLEDDVVR